MVIMSEKHRVALVHDAFKLILENIKHSKKTDYIILHVFEMLNKEKVYYNGKPMDFTEFIKAVEYDTSSYWFSAKVKNVVELKAILVKLMTAIKNVILKKREMHDVFDFIDNEYGYDISHKDSLNFLNFLINYKFYDQYDTFEMLRTVYPELAEKAGDEKEEPMDVLEIRHKVKKSHNYSQKNQGPPKKFEGKPFEGKPFEGKPFPKPEGGGGGEGKPAGKPFSFKPKVFPPKQRKTQRRRRA